MIRTVEVTQRIQVTINESKFTPEFMEEFRRDFYEFNTIEQHMEHLAQLYARGIATPYNDFIEGYGLSDDFGIKLKCIDQSEYLEPEK